MARLMGQQKITTAEAGEIRERFASWNGPSGPFVASEAARYSVTRETIRRILRHETHLGLGDRPLPWAGTPTPEPPSAALESEARRLFESLTAPASESAVEAFKQEVAKKE